MNIQITQNTGEMVVYQPDAELTLEVKVVDETVWLNQQQIAELFGVKQPAISKHLNNIFRSGELDRNSVHSILEYTATDGKKYNTQFFNLDAILSIGYRVNSTRATQFRIWANKILKDYILRGYAVNRQLIALQERTDERFLRVENRLDEQQEKVDFLVRAHTECTERKKIKNNIKS